MACCDVGAHELTYDLSGGKILRLARLDEIASQFFVDPELECNILERHAVSVPIVYPHVNQHRTEHLEGERPYV